MQLVTYQHRINFNVKSLKMITLPVLYEYRTVLEYHRVPPVPSSKFYQAREGRNKLTQMGAHLLAKSQAGQSGDAGKHKRGTGFRELRQSIDKQTLPQLHPIRGAKSAQSEKREHSSNNRPAHGLLHQGT